MEGMVYVLCAVTALLCSGLLFRGWVGNRVRLLLWCAVFFLALTVENAILFADAVLIPSTDLSLLRNAVAVGGIGVFLCGLAWDTK